jgi:hypothetical protein
LKMCMVVDESMYDDYDACPNIYEGKREWDDKRMNQPRKQDRKATMKER